MNRSDIIKKNISEGFIIPKWSIEAKKNNYLFLNFNCVPWIVCLVWGDVTQLYILPPVRKYNSSYHNEHLLIKKIK